MADRDSFHCLRGPHGILHLPKRAGIPFCDQRDGLVSVIHPIDRAGMWCTACMQAATATARNEPRGA